LRHLAKVDLIRDAKRCKRSHIGGREHLTFHESLLSNLALEDVRVMKKEEERGESRKRRENRKREREKERERENGKLERISMKALDALTAYGQLDGQVRRRC